MDFSVFLTVEGIYSLLTLTVLEVVLGIDNIIFISIVCDKLPRRIQNKARSIGLVLALVVRLALLSVIKIIVDLKDYTLFTLPFADSISLTHEAAAISARDLILFLGGLFLMSKSITEINSHVEGHEENHGNNNAQISVSKVIMQIILIDIVFSFDSILSAVALVDHLPIMFAAVIISITIMLLYARAISDFINSRPSIKMLALSFLVMIGFVLIAESFGQEIHKGYIYFSMTFAFIVESLNIRARKNARRGGGKTLREREQDKKNNSSEEAS